MATRILTRLTVAPGPEGVLALAGELPAALNGEGPALAPIPAGPQGYIQRITETVRADDPSAPLEDDQVAVVLTTSGSMGEPRGVLLSGSALLASASAANARLGGPARWIVALPVTHVAGLQVLVRAHLSGVAPVPLDSVGGAARFSALEFTRATSAARAMSDVDGAPLRTALVPTQLARILALGQSAGDALRAYDSIMIGGAAVSTGLVAQAETLGARIVTTYGMTESCGGCVYDGLPLPGVGVSIANPDDTGSGLIELTGKTIAVGYRLAPEQTAISFGPGLHRTSDFGRIEDDGRLVVLGRDDDVVQVGGHNVSVAAVERAIESYPEIALAAVVSTPDEQWGARLTAFVTKRPGYEPPTAGFSDSIKEYVGAALGNESRPRAVVLLDTLPTLPAGKIDRELLRTQAAHHQVEQGN